MRALGRWVALLTSVFLAHTVAAQPLTSAQRAQLAAGHPVTVIVELNATSVDDAAAAARERLGLRHDDAAILAMRAQRYAAIKAAVGAADEGPHARPIHDYKYLPMAVWQLSSLAALNRLLADPRVRAVHRQVTVHVDSVSDLAFIDQPQTAEEGATGAGTTIAVIDGGLGTNYTTYSDFGPCTAVGTPAGTCRVVYNVDYYPGLSQEVTHGTNVSAIALGVAPAADLAMFDVFDGTGASSSDILDAMDTILQLQSTYDIVAVNMSFGDNTSNATQCSQSVFAPAIAALYNAGISSVVAAGNSGSKSGLSDPACVPEAISVGAVYNASYGTVSWELPAGTCTDTSAADLVTCFSQSAPYLSLLAPGTFVSAPSSAFELSGTSQATPHVAGSVAVLRARYPQEPLSETLQRLQASSVHDTDPGDGLASPRLDLLDSTNEGTALALSGNGPSEATPGQQSTYTITVTNSGPLTATDVTLNDALPSGATFVSASSGCSDVSSTVSCAIGSLADGGSTTITITVGWSSSGPVYDAASVTSAEINTASPSQQMIAFGNSTLSSPDDAPLPVWSLAVLAALLLYGALAPIRRRAGMRR